MTLLEKYKAKIATCESRIEEIQEKKNNMKIVDPKNKHKFDGSHKKTSDWKHLCRAKRTWETRKECYREIIADLK